MLTFCETRIWFLSVSEDPYLFKTGKFLKRVDTLSVQVLHPFHTKAETCFLKHNVNLFSIEAAETDVCRLQM